MSDFDKESYKKMECGRMNERREYTQEFDVEESDNSCEYHDSVIADVMVRKKSEKYKKMK